jgi:hypothetical protein
MTASEKLRLPSGDPERAHHPRRSADGGLEWNGCLLLESRVHSAELLFGNSTHVLS